MKRILTLFLCVLLCCSFLLTSCTTTEEPEKKEGTNEEASNPSESSDPTEPDPEDSGDPEDPDDPEDSGDPSDPEDTPDPEEEEPASVCINEVCTKNTKIAAPNGEYYDLLELYNVTDEEIDLSLWTLTDSQKDLAKYTFQSGTKIASHGYLLVYCVGAEALVTMTPFEGYKAPFKLASEGEVVYLYTNEGTLASQMTIPAISKDVSFGRYMDGSVEYATLNSSFGSSNNGTELAVSLSFSHESGFYDEAFDLTMKAPAGYTIKYTLDCSDPSISETAITLGSEDSIAVTELPQGSQYYTTYIQEKVSGNKTDLSSVDHCFVVRACAFDETDTLASNIITKNYFIGYQEKTAYLNIPIVCLTTTPSDLYDQSTGFFYHTQDDGTECQVNFTYIGEDGTYSFDQEVGIRIRGTSTRSAVQKNLNVFAKSKYGVSKFPQSLFPDADFTKSIVLRSDYLSNLSPGEGFLDDLASKREISTAENEVVMVFVDGEFFGIYFLYERFSADYVEAHYGVDADNVQIVKKGASSGAEASDSEALTDFKALYKKMCGTIDNATYAEICSKIDMQSFVDLLAVNMYIGNDDFSMAQNISCWRAKEVDPENPYADGKWRFVLYDLDYACGIITGGSKFKTGGAYEGKSAQTWVVDTFTAMQAFAGVGFCNWDCMKGSLLEVPEFVELFVTTFEDVANVDFEETRAVAALQAQKDLIAPHMEPYIKLYNNVDSSGNVRDAKNIWSNRQTRYFTYLKERFEYIMGYLKTDFNLQGELVTVQITSNIQDVKVGLGTTKVQLAEGTWSGQYYTDYDLELRAKEVTGYTFTGWVIEGATLTEGTTTDTTIQIHLGDEGATIQALYTKE